MVASVSYGVAVLGSELPRSSVGTVALAGEGLTRVYLRRQCCALCDSGEIRCAANCNIAVALLPTHHVPMATSLPEILVKSISSYRNTDIVPKPLTVHISLVLV